MANTNKLLPMVHYYASNNYPNQLQAVCRGVIKRSPGDPVAHFWLAFGKLLEGRHSEAIQDLQRLPLSPETSPAATAAMILGHQSAKVIDHESVQRLMDQKEMLEASCSNKAKTMMAQFYWLSGSIEQARMMVERVIRHSEEEDDGAQSLLGWLMISQRDDDYGLGGDDEIDEALSTFDAVLSQKPVLEALMGKAKALEQKNECGQALEVLREVMVRYSWYYPATLECAWLLVQLGKWSEALDMADNILVKDPQCIDALNVKAMNHFLCSGDNKSGIQTVRAIKEGIFSLEPRNAELCFQTAHLYGRISGDVGLLEETKALAECAHRLGPENPAYACEYGHQQMLTGDCDGALQLFQVASNMNDLNMDVMYGTVECLLQKGMVDDAATQLEMLSGVATTTGSLSQIEWLKFMLSFCRGTNAEEGALMLEKACLQRQKDVDGMMMGKELLIKLNLTQVLDVISKVLQTLGSTPKIATEATSPYLTKTNRILSSLLNYAPGHTKCHLLLAQVQYLENNLEGAIQRASDLQRNCLGEGHASLLMCQVYLHQGKISSARLALDEAIAASFAIRDMPSYHIVNAQVLIAEDRLGDAKKGLEDAIQLPGMKTPLAGSKTGNLLKRNAVPTVHERASVFLLMATVLTKIQKDSPEAIKIINDAIREFDNTTEAVRFTIADCELAVNRGDVQTALKKLRKIGTGSPHFSKAQIAMANIHLNHRRDKAAYVKCYLELSEHHPGYESSLMLGEALMSIQEPEKAIKAFEDAFELNPKDSDLACKIADAMVTTHEYQKAIDFYNKAIRNSPTHLPLQQKLATLLIRLKRGENAIQVCNKSIQVAKQFAGTVEQQTHTVDMLCMMGRVHKDQGNSEDFLKAHQEALGMQIELLSKLRGQHPDLVAMRKEKAVALSLTLGQHYMDHQQFPKAEETILSTMEYCIVKKPVWQMLARLCLIQGRIDACEEYCLNVLKDDPANEEAGFMIAEVLFHQGQQASADAHFLRLLGENPTDYKALKSLIKILRCAGRLDEVKEHIENADASGSTGAIQDPGMHFCKGLQCKFKKHHNAALNHFSAARKDACWATDALFEMVGIILNPEQDIKWLDSEPAEECMEVSRSALSLLDQVPADAQQSIKYKILWSYATMATKNPTNVQEAISSLLEIASSDQNNVPVLLALATGFMILGQTPKARNQLKRVQKIQVKLEEVEDFERAWLLLADIHIQGGKFDLAQDLCKKCLKYNKSCSRAWECLGQIMEREQAYQDAAQHYESAWKFENEASAEVGYKLAFNLLKAERLVEAIDVCYKVLKEFPDCPRLHDEILNKAISGLRP